MTAAARYGLALILLSLPLAGDDPEPISIVICHPGSPGTTEQAQRTMDAFSRAIEKGGGLPEGAVRCAFYAEADPGLEFIRGEKPVLGIVSLAFYLRYREELDLDPLLQVIRQEKATQTFHILAKEGRFADLEALRGKRLVSKHLFDPAFLTRVILEGREEGFLQIVETRKPLKAIRAVARGEEDAVLVDGEEWQTLREMRGLGDRLVEILRSEDLPTEPVVTIGGHADDPRIEKVKEALKNLSETERGAEVCADLRMNGFREPDREAFDKAVRLYSGKTR